MSRRKKTVSGKKRDSRSGDSRGGTRKASSGKRFSKREEQGASFVGGAPKSKGRFVAGIHAVTEVLKVRAHDIHKVYFKLGWESSPELSELHESCEHYDLEIEVRKESFFNSICATHQGVVVDVTSKPELDWSLIEDKDSSGKLVVILDEVEDPHNLGAILRTAWLMGALAVFVTDKRSTHLNASVSKVACGGAEYVPVVVEKSYQVLLKDLKEAGFWVYGLAGESDAGLWDIEFPENVALVVGAEAKGIRSSTRSFCDQLLSIDQKADGASYNASVAAAISIAEVRRQWKIVEKS